MEAGVKDGATPLLKSCTGPPAIAAGTEYLVFSFILVFPTPNATTEVDEVRFTKRYLHGQRTHQSIMDSVAIHSAARSHDKFSIKCKSSLKSMRNATIEIFLTFFQTMFGDDTDCDLVTFTSAGNDELFMCIKLSDRLAEQFADMADYPLQLHMDCLTKLGIKISDTTDVIPAFVRFDAFQKNEGLLKWYPKLDAPEEASILRRVDTIRLLYDKITDYIDLPEMEQMGLVTYFPCHNWATLAALRNCWASVTNPSASSLHQPIEMVRSYFGEGIAFYFLFVQELARATLVLIPVAALVRSGYFVYLEHSDGRDLLAVLYSVVLMGWFAVFNKHWRRTEAFYANRWGMDRRPSNSEIHELLNPNFAGELRPWPIDENETVEEPIGSKLAVGLAISILGQLLFIALIVICVSYTQYKASVEDARGHASAQKVAALAVSAQIQVFSYTWGWLSAVLTDQEQHMTIRAWHESKARKTFVVGFFNTFFSFFYVGFFQRFVDPKAVSSNTLQTSMQIVYGTYVILGLVDLVKPYLESRTKVWRARGRRGTDSSNYMPVIEKQAALSKYTGESLAGDYMQVCFPIGFVVLFSVVMPLLTVVLAFVTLLVQQRADAWKLLNTYRRPFPDMVDGIGMWNKVMHGLEIISICVNLLLLLTHFDAARFLAFVPGLREDLTARPVVTKALIFFVTLNVILACKAGFDFLVPDETERTTLEKKRQDYQRLRLLEKKAEFREGATMWAEGDEVASAFHENPPNLRSRACSMPPL